MFDKSKWIWYTAQAEDDTYGEFYAPLQCREGEKTVLRISCDGDYALYINGTFVDSNQYADFEHYKIFDEIDLTPHVHGGENHFAVRVWHAGIPTQRYKPAPAGLLFEAECGGETVLASSESILSRESRAFRCRYLKRITGQLGLSFLYDADKEDGWLTGGGDGFAPSVPAGKNCTMFPRPVRKLVYGLPRPMKSVSALSGNSFLVDLGEERTGMPLLRLFTEARQKITVSYGEHLKDGHVCRKIATRDFSFEYIAKEGENSFFNPFLRLGCRYLEVEGEQPFRLSYAGCVPHFFPAERADYSFLRGRDRQIYEICLNTLDLCMSEHYMDCPWREQDLYAFDARNQMLCGYTAFKGGNFAYARANLLLMSKDEREDGLLSICFPCGVDLTIPSFSLYYFLAVREYTQYAGDATLAAEVFGKLESVLKVFLSHMQEGLVVRFSGSEHWNFYDWVVPLTGSLGYSNEEKPDLILNALTVLALESFREICSAAGRAFAYEGVLSALKERIRAVFYDGEKKLFFHSREEKVYTELGNALCVLCGIAPPESAAAICEGIVSGSLIACTLSMRAFKYDALLHTDKEKYAPFILGEIRRDYGMMLDAGSTTVWETVEGAPAFGGAGSLCHGWSAVPAHYFRLLLS